MLSDEQEEHIKYIRSSYHKMRVLCQTFDLLIITYEELEAERKKNKELLFLCDICKERDK
jgi:hypothetical protein